ncbi:MAG: 4a-hydroxytetrahydrobiopterin dehydratase [Acidimicrobiia bacterium]
MSRTPLTPEELADLALTLPEWDVTADALIRTLTFRDFVGTFGCASRVALIAQRMDHHPDMDIRYDTLTFRLSTHTAGGVTGMDVKLAFAIENALTR